MGWTRFARLVCVLGVLGLIGSIGASAAECSPNLSVNTPTPTISWDQVNHANTVGYRVYWKRDSDATWRGFKNFPAFIGEWHETPVWPGITMPVAVQKIVPLPEQQQNYIDFMVVAYSSTNQESAPSTILRICMPNIWIGGDYY
jgi:hypothetical protein